MEKYETEDKYDEKKKKWASKVKDYVSKDVRDFFPSLRNCQHAKAKFLQAVQLAS